MTTNIITRFILFIALLLVSNCLHLVHNGTIDPYVAPPEFSPQDFTVVSSDPQPEHNQKQSGGGAESAVAAAALLLEVGKVVGAQFEVTCKFGYKRGNAITIKNALKTEINMNSLYFDSGKLLTPGEEFLNENGQTTFQMSKKSGSATGSCGLMTWKLNDSWQLVIFFENPWSPYNQAAVCLYQKSSMSDKARFDQLYYKKNISPNCAYFDNSKTELDYYYPKPAVLQLGGFTIAVREKYQLIDGCYIQEIIAVVS